MLIFQILGTILLAFLAGWSYRCGGSSNGQRWVREIGVGISILGCLLLWLQWSWGALLILGTVWVETTYFKKKGTDATFVNWLLVGLSFSLVLLPWVITTHHWLGFGIRTIVLTPIIALWCRFNGNVQWSEGGRGALQVLTIPILFI